MHAALQQNQICLPGAYMGNTELRTTRFNIYTHGLRIAIFFFRQFYVSTRCTSCAAILVIAAAGLCVAIFLPMQSYTNTAICVMRDNQFALSEIETIDFRPITHYHAHVVKCESLNWRHQTIICFAIKDVSNHVIFISAIMLRCSKI